jgi:hypothetical protein
MRLFAIAFFQFATCLFAGFGGLSCGNAIGGVGHGGIQHGWDTITILMVWGLLSGVSGAFSLGTRWWLSAVLFAGPAVLLGPIGASVALVSDGSWRGFWGLGLVVPTPFIAGYLTYFGLRAINRRCSSWLEKILRHAYWSLIHPRRRP